MTNTDLTDRQTACLYPVTRVGAMTACQGVGCLQNKQAGRKIVVTVHIHENWYLIPLCRLRYPSYSSTYSLRACDVMCSVRAKLRLNRYCRDCLVDCIILTIYLSYIDDEMIFYGNWCWLLRS